MKINEKWRRYNIINKEFMKINEKWWRYNIINKEFMKIFKKYDKGDQDEDEAIKSQNTKELHI